MRLTRASSERCSGSGATRGRRGAIGRRCRARTASLADGRHCGGRTPSLLTWMRSAVSAPSPPPAPTRTRTRPARDRRACPAPRARAGCRPARRSSACRRDTAASARDCRCPRPSPARWRWSSSSWARGPMRSGPASARRRQVVHFDRDLRPAGSALGRRAHEVAVLDLVEAHGLGDGDGHVVRQRELQVAAVARLHRRVDVASTAVMVPRTRTLVCACAAAQRECREQRAMQRLSTIDVRFGSRADVGRTHRATATSPRIVAATMQDPMSCRLSCNGPGRYARHRRNIAS